MRRRTWANRISQAVLLGVCATSTPGVADAPTLEASLSCRPEAAPGRVLCELVFSAPRGGELVWVDALVTQAPAFAPPLRSRVAAERFARSGAAAHTLGLAFVASAAGVGQVSVSARGVACRGTGEQRQCRPAQRLLTGELRVGS